MRKKIITAICVLGMTASLIMGFTYAWFTNQESADSASAEAGYLNISLTGGIHGTDDIFPAEEGRLIDYTITNSSSREAVVQLKVGTLSAYVMPESYLDGGYVIKSKHDIMQALSPDAKMNINNESSEFIKLAAIPETDIVSKFKDELVLTGTGSDYLGKDAEGNLYFLLSEDGTAKCTFEIALSETAGNEYQYALLTLGEATALATQHNAAAIAAAFDGLDISSLD